ncbi:glycosyltransferase [Microbacterium hydrocarbonoxydans]|uniref:glycosyltransferase n=1 Tax=Microbacterium hydrocarbonoxydans TaxID=273678 RepID=UPI0013DA69B1|nr:glycosyltransferase [Microbacterium hydrocarbonoxydans]
MTDLVVLSLEGWDEVWRRNQYLVAGLLDADPELRVLFVEPPVDPLHDLRGRRRPGTGHGLRLVRERLWSIRPVKWLPRRIDPGGDGRRMRAIVRAARGLGFTAPRLWVNDPAGAPLMSRTGWPTMYDITDDWLSASRPPAELSRIAAGERLLLERADAVVACSPELVRRKSGARDGIRLIPNAVDAAAYSTPGARPRGLPSGPVALYLGTLHSDRLDAALCARIARELAGRVAIVLAGPDLLSPSVQEALDGAGVRRLGPLNRPDVPGHLQHADVLIVPHLITSFTDSLDPIKLYEYQAAARPVVSTAVAGFRDASDPRIRIAGHDDFAEAILDAVASPLPDGPAEVADWSTRVSQMRDVIASIA